jgi:hypothetical protein
MGDATPDGLQKNIEAVHPRSVQSLALVIEEIKETAH